MDDSVRTARSAPGLSLLALLGLSIALSACGGGGGGPTGPGEAEEVTGSSPSVFPPSDGGTSPGSWSSLEGGSPWVVVESSGFFEVSVWIVDHTNLSETKAFDPRFQPYFYRGVETPGDAVWMSIENVSGQPQTFDVTEDSYQRFAMWDEATGTPITFAVEIGGKAGGTQVALAPGELIRGRAEFPNPLPPGRYRVQSWVATNDPRVPGPLGFSFEKIP